MRKLLSVLMFAALCGAAQAQQLIPDVKIGGIYQATPNALSDKQVQVIALDPNGNMRANTLAVVTFNPPLASSAKNTNIVVSVPSLGTGNTNSTVVAHGFLY